MFLVGKKGFPSRHVPDSGGLVEAAGGQLPVVGTPANAFDPQRVTTEGAHWSSGR